VTELFKKKESSVKEFPHWWHVRVLEDDFKYISTVGNNRYQSSELKGWKDKSGSKNSTKHIAGVAGEWAAWMVLKTELPQLESKADFERVCGGDLPGGIEVKSCQSENRWLWNLVIDLDHFKSDRIYVNTLVHLLPEYVVVQGWQTGAEILKNHRKSKHGINDHDIMIYDWKNLRDIDELFDEVIK
jgi:hypothetical protein